MLFLLTACTTGNSNEEIQQVESQETIVTKDSIEVLAENLQVPWSMNKRGDTFYISERTGHIMKVVGDEQSRQKVVLKKPLATAAEAGLLGFVLAPDFSNTGKAFAYYTYQDDFGQYNRIVTLKLENDVWEEEELLLDKIPSGQYHHGGRLKIGPDGKLYATTGDAATDPVIAQDVKSLGGKILRMELDGSIPADNPFANSHVYSFGHRNPQGLAWTEEGLLYESEHGPSAHDEINLLKKGGNYGWPTIIGDEKRAGVESPLFQSGADMTWAPSGMAYHNGKLYVATLRGNAVREFDLETGKTKEVISGLGRIRDVLIEDGILYFVSNNTDGRGTPDKNDDKLYRVELGGL
ncbi:glucose/arabinose dehydrogenase [Robertmurraya andreesenii]|uniref:Glucose/arabinose dehydrogenase n=1 Tax=Anoxybacillus andreesenii TaxID=1325932 RepID=A0ABT9V0A9_9BACL|nr:glucose/arabinose dehydrogenase [Robertmurraya andreesenii]